MAEKRFENLLNAVLSGDRAKVDRVLEESEFDFGDYVMMPQQFNELPRATKERLARVYKDNPDVVPEMAQPYVEAALIDITSAPAATPKTRSATRVVQADPVPIPRLRPAPPHEQLLPGSPPFLPSDRFTTGSGPQWNPLTDGNLSPENVFTIPPALAPGAPIADRPQVPEAPETGATRRGLEIPSSANFEKVDPRLQDMVKTAAQRFPYRVEVTPDGGFNSRVEVTPHHPRGLAIDVLIYDENGKELPRLRHGPSFRIYERWAQTVRQVLLEKYPELTDKLRFGGYFHQGESYDQMHLDISGGGMALGSWERGLYDPELLPGAVSIGTGEPDKIRLEQLGYWDVGRFQEDYNVNFDGPPLAVDGKIGPKTRAAMDRALKSASPLTSGGVPFSDRQMMLETTPQEPGTRLPGDRDAAAPKKGVGVKIAQANAAPPRARPDVSPTAVGSLYRQNYEAGLREAGVSEAEVAQRSETLRRSDRFAELVALDTFQIRRTANAPIPRAVEAAIDAALSKAAKNNGTAKAVSAVMAELDDQTAGYPSSKSAGRTVARGATAAYAQGLQDGGWPEPEVAAQAKTFSGALDKQLDATAGEAAYYVAPVDGSWGARDSSQFQTPRAGGKRQHSGNDLQATNGSKAVAMIGGKVLYAGYNQGYQWNAVVAGDDGIMYRYATHGPLDVTVGQRVEQGVPVGTIARNHLHLETIQKSSPVWNQMRSLAGQFVSTQWWIGTPQITTDPSKLFAMTRGATLAAGEPLTGKPIDLLPNLLTGKQPGGINARAMLALSQWGFAGPHAVRDFQTAMGDKAGPVDGIVGPQTRRGIELAKADPGFLLRARLVRDGVPTPQLDGTIARLRGVAPVDMDDLGVHVTAGGALRSSERGEHVRQWQRFLNQQGVTDDQGEPLKEDGIYGRRTEAATRTWQRMSPGLGVDGVVGIRTAGMAFETVEQQEASLVGITGWPDPPTGDGAAGNVAEDATPPGGIPAPQQPVYFDNLAQAAIRHGAAAAAPMPVGAQRFRSQPGVMGQFATTRTVAAQRAAILGASGIGESSGERLQSVGPGRRGRYQPLTSAGIRGSVADAYAAASLRPHAPGIEITPDVAVQDMYAFGNALRGYEAARTAAQRDAAALSNRLAREKQQQRSRELRLTSLPPGGGQFGSPPSFGSGRQQTIPSEPAREFYPPFLVPPPPGFEVQNPFETPQGQGIPPTKEFPPDPGQREAENPWSGFGAGLSAPSPSVNPPGAGLSAPPANYSPPSGTFIELDPFERESVPGGMGGF